MPPTYALTADLQLHPYMRYSTHDGKYYTSRLRDMLTALDAVVDRAVARKASGLIVAGDVFEDRRAVPIPVMDVTARAFRQWGRKLPVYVLAGNHDAYLRTADRFTSITGLDGDGVTVVAETPYMLGDVALVPWSDSFEVWLDTVSRLPKTAKHLISHGLIDAVHPGGWPTEKMPVSRFGDVWLGDVHTPDRYPVPGTKKWVRYIGSPYQIDYRDAGSVRGFWFWTPGKGAEFVENMDSPRFHNITTTAQTQDVCDGDFVRVEATNEVALDKIKKALPREVSVEAFVAQEDDASARLEIEQDSPAADVIAAYMKHLGVPDTLFADYLAYGVRLYESIQAKKSGQSVAAPVLRIGRVEYRNFGPFAEASVDFSVPGFTQIDGRVENVPGCVNNGAGKSMLLDGVFWATYDASLRKDYNADDYLRRGSDGPMSVTVTYVRPDGTPYLKIHRERKSGRTRVTLEKDGEPMTAPGTTGMTNEQIEALLGLSRDVALNTVFFAARDEVRGFYQATDAEKKELLETLLGLAAFTEARASAELDAKTAASNAAQAQSNLTVYTTRVEALADQVTSLGEEHAEIAGQDVAALQRRVRMGTHKIRTLQGVLSDLEQEAAALKEPEPEPGLDAVERDIQALQDSIATLKRDREENSRELIKKAREQDGLLSATTCPTCGAPLKGKKERAKHAAAIQKDMDALGVKIDAADMQLQLDTAALADKSREAVQLRKGYDERAREAVELAEEIEADFQAIRDELADSRAGLADVKARVELVEGAERRLKQRMEELNTKRLSLEKALRQTTETLLAANAERDRAEFFVTAFGNKGVKAFLIETQLPELSRVATKYARRLFGIPVTVSLSATTKMKTKDTEKEQISVDVDIPGFASSYAGASQGQKARLDLALLLACKAIHQRRSAVRLSGHFFDELLDHLDEAGRDSVVDMIRDMAAEAPVVVISHGLLQDYADRTLTVYHDGNSAVIREAR